MFVSDEVRAAGPPSDPSHPAPRHSVFSGLLHVRHRHHPHHAGGFHLRHHRHRRLPQAEEAVEKQEEVSYSTKAAPSLTSPASSLTAFTFLFLQGHGDADAERSAVGAPAGPTPPKPHVPAGSPAAELKAAGPRVSPE